MSECVIPLGDLQRSAPRQPRSAENTGLGTQATGMMLTAGDARQLQFRSKFVF